MRGRDVHDACGGRQEIHDQALVIDGYANDPRAESAEQARRRHIPGILDRDAVAGLEQDPGDQVDGMLGAAGDDDRVFSGQHRSRPGDPAGDGPPQPDPPGRVAVLPRLGGDGGGDPAAPHRRREQRGVREAWPEIETVAVRGRPEVRRPAREPGAGAKGGRRARPLGWCRGRGCHHAAPARASLRVALGHQAAIHSRHRMPGHAELIGQLAAGDELIPGQQAAPGNGPAELLVQLPGQRLPGFRVKEDVHQAGISPAWYGRTVPFWISTANHLPHKLLVTKPIRRPLLQRWEE